MRESDLELMVRIHKALAHPVRVRILAMLRSGEVCVCQLNAVIGLAPSTISAHLGELKDAGLVAERKAGRWVHYRLAAEGAGARVLEASFAALAGESQVHDDDTLLAAVTAKPVEEICRPGFDAATLWRGCCSPRGASSKERA